MSPEMQRLYDLTYSPIVTPRNLISNARLENYEYIKLYKDVKQDKKGAIIVEMKCTRQDGVVAIYYYHFDEKDYLLSIDEEVEGIKKVVFDRQSKLVELKKSLKVVN